MAFGNSLAPAPSRGVRTSAERRTRWRDATSRPAPPRALSPRDDRPRRARCSRRRGSRRGGPSASSSSSSSSSPAQRAHRLASGRGLCCSPWMPSFGSPLLLRITAALSAASMTLVACGGDTADTGAAAGGSSSGGSPAGGTSANAGSSGRGAAGGMAGNGGAAGAVGCQRALPATTPGGSVCRTTADCQPGSGLSACLPPGVSSCGGSEGPFRPTCKTDGDCAGIPEGRCQTNSGPKKYCDQKCTSDAFCGSGNRCEVGTGSCVPQSCADGICPQGTFCNEAKTCAYQYCNEERGCADGFSCSTSTFTCAPTTCTGAAGECSASFVCDVGSKLCTRQTCACDTECAGEGFCIGGSCYPTAAHCDGGCSAGRPLTTAGGELVVARLVRGRGAAGEGFREGGGW